MNRILFGVTALITAGFTVYQYFDGAGWFTLLYGAIATLLLIYCSYMSHRAHTELQAHYAKMKRELDKMEDGVAKEHLIELYKSIGIL